MRSLQFSIAFYMSIIFTIQELTMILLKLEKHVEFYLEEHAMV